MTKTIYYAVNGRGQGRVFTTKPERNIHWKLWEGEEVGFISMLVMDMEAEGFELPSITFKDEPVELKLTLEHG